MKSKKLGCMEIFVDKLYDATLDTLKVIPILFLAYLLVSFIEHDHSHKFSKLLTKSKGQGVFFASVLGCVPQCGFSSVMADLYSHNRVTLGMLIAVFVATSDEAIPIMITNTQSVVPMLILIAIKVVLAILWGYAIDFAVAAFKGRKHKKLETEQENAHSAEHQHAHIHECGHIHTDDCGGHCGHSHGSCCGDNIFMDAFSHTLSIAVYIFVATFAINLIVGYCGLDVLKNLLTDNVYVQIVIASLIGLIPNCASSVLLVELFSLYQSLSFAALVAGLTSGAGVGLVILFTKNKKHPLKNLGILCLQYLIGVLSGVIVALIMLAFKL